MVTVKCPMNSGEIMVNGRSYGVFNGHTSVSEEDANALAGRAGYAIVGANAPVPEALPVRNPGVRNAPPPAPAQFAGSGKYRLRAPMNSGVAIILDRQYEVREHTIWVDDLHTLNHAVEVLGYLPMGMERWKTVDTVLVRRNGGLGDILMLTPVFREMKRCNPQLKITLACLENFMEVCRHLPTVDRIVPMSGGRPDDHGDGFTDPTGMHFPVWLNMEQIVEKNMERNDRHRVDIFAQVAGFDTGIGDKQLDYRVTHAEWEWAGRRLAAAGAQPGGKVLGMGLRTTCFNRNLPGANNDAGTAGEVNRQVAEMAVREGWKVVLFDHDTRFGWEADGIINMCGRTTHREMGALMSRCSMFLGPDSGAWHMACALRIPNVVYFGAIDWRLRVTSPMTRVVARAVHCYPCNSYGCHQGGIICTQFSPQELWDAAREKWAQYAVSPAVLETVEQAREQAVVVDRIDTGHAGAPTVPEEALSGN